MMKNLLILLTVGFCLNTAFAQQIQDTSARYDQYGKKVDRETLNAEARSGILVFESKNQDYKLWFDIRVQVDAQMFAKNTMTPIGNGATIRRARFATKTNISKNWYGELDLNFANGVLELNDAYVRYDFLNGLSSSVGNFKERFSLSETSSSRYLNFMERAMVVNAFAPSRFLGWEVVYSGKRFFIVGGVYGQEVEDAEKRTYVEDNNKDYGRDEGLSLTGKFVLQPFGDQKDYGLHLAYGYSYRQPKTSIAPGEYEGVRYSTRSLSNINRKKYLDTDVLPNYDHQTLSNIEAAAFYKGLGIQAEYITNRTFRKNNLERLDFGGFYVQTVYMLFGGKQVYNKVDAEFTLPDKGKKWGDVELALRYEYIDLNDKTVYGGAAEAITAGVNFYTSKNVKFQFDYSYVNHDRYASGKNKINVGDDVTGAYTKDPTKVANEKGKAGEDYGMFGVRCEINF
jgi:phosphate-selective porin OprO and OprP